MSSTSLPRVVTCFVVGPLEGVRIPSTPGEQVVWSLIKIKCRKFAKNEKGYDPRVPFFGAARLDVVEKKNVGIAKKLKTSR